MKTFHLLFAIVCAACILTGCNKIKYESDFEKSYKAWQDFKDEYGNSYQYKVSDQSWTGVLWHTILTVDNGHVIKREYQVTERVYHQGDSQPTYEIREHWIENEDEIGSHSRTGAFDAITLDEVYDRAKNEWLKKQKSSSYYFKTENEGMISLCGYNIDGCMDDCFVGIRIDYITSWRP